MRIARCGLVGLFFVSTISCQQQPDLDSLRAEILELHRSFIQAHLDKDAAFIARPTSPDYVFVGGGELQRMDAGEMERTLSEYLDSTEFSEYRDVDDPIIGISRDGSLAWAIVQVRTAGSSSSPDGSSRTFDIRWAWITLYERHGEGWLRLADVSTNRPYEQGP
jgi:hypothetical protein